MSCNCVSEIEQKVFSKLTEANKYKKPVKKVRMRGVVIRFGGEEATAPTVNTLEIELEGQKKMETMNMIHTFCPFCGVKYGDPK